MVDWHSTTSSCLAKAIKIAKTVDITEGNPEAK